MPLAGAQRLADALIHPTKADDINWLHAHAVAEAAATTFPHVQAQVDGVVAGAVEQKLRALYAGAAQDIYTKAAARYNEAAAAFTEAAGTVDVETTDANDVANMADDQRQAWAQAPTLTTQIDTTLPVLVTAAQLAGATVDNETGSLLALCVDTTNQPKRALWTAWDCKDGGRCGKWAALVKLGATIRAADLTDIGPYERPRDVEYRLEPQPGGPHGTYRTVAYDPELPVSPDNRPPAEPEKAMIPGRRMVTR
jgi:hypothetical protein